MQDVNKWVCASTCMWGSSIQKLTWDGPAAQAGNQHNITVQQRRRRERFVREPADAKEGHSPCSFCITLAMSTDDRPKFLGEAMLSRCSCVKKVGHRRWWQRILQRRPEWDIPSATPSPSSLFLFLVSLQDQVQSKLRFHAGTAGSPSNRSTSPCRCLKKRCMWRECYQFNSFLSLFSLFIRTWCWMTTLLSLEGIHWNTTICMFQLIFK